MLGATVDTFNGEILRWLNEVRERGFVWGPPPEERDATGASRAGGVRTATSLPSTTSLVNFWNFTEFSRMDVMTNEWVQSFTLFKEIMKYIPSHLICITKDAALWSESQSWGELARQAVSLMISAGLNVVDVGDFYASISAHRKYSCRYHFMSNPTTMNAWTKYLQRIQEFMYYTMVPAYWKTYFKTNLWLPSIKKPIAMAHRTDFGLDVLSRAYDQYVTSLEFAEAAEPSGAGGSSTMPEEAVGESLPSAEDVPMREEPDDEDPWMSLTVAPEEAAAPVPGDFVAEPKQKKMLTSKIGSWTPTSKLSPQEHNLFMVTPRPTKPPAEVAELERRTKILLGTADGGSPPVATGDADATSSGIGESLPIVPEGPESSEEETVFPYVAGIRDLRKTLGSEISEEDFVEQIDTPLVMLPENVTSVEVPTEGHIVSEYHVGDDGDVTHTDFTVYDERVYIADESSLDAKELRYIQSLADDADAPDGEFAEEYEDSEFGGDDFEDALEELYILYLIVTGNYNGYLWHNVHPVRVSCRLVVFS